MAIIKCPHCKKQTISTSDTCLNCGESISQCGNQPLNQNSMEKKITNNSNKSGTIVITILGIIVIIGIIGFLSDLFKDSNETKTETCPICYKTYTNGDDLHSIAWTGMCEKCYENFKYKQEIQEELKKYYEQNQ